MSETIKNYFEELNGIECKTEKKQWLTYISWADAWKEVKTKFPKSTYTIYEDDNWFPYWSWEFWIDVKVWVSVENTEHIMRLPVLDWANKSMRNEEYKYSVKGYNWWPDREKVCKKATQFDINKAIMRALVKACAMHWLWMYVYRWEDLPDDWEVKTTAPKPNWETTKKVLAHNKANPDDVKCPLCQWTTTYKEWTTKAGKPYKAHFCNGQNCKGAIWL